MFDWLFQFLAESSLIGVLPNWFVLLLAVGGSLLIGAALREESD